MVKLDQNTKDHQTEPLTFANNLEISLSASPLVLLSSEKKLFREVPKSHKLPVPKLKTFVQSDKKEISDSHRLDSDPENDGFCVHDAQFSSDFYEIKKTNDNIFHTNVTDISLSNDSFQNQYESSFDFDWSESDCSFRQLFPETENHPCITTGKEERDQIDGVEFVSFETERDMVEYTKVELDFKGVAAASQSDDGLEMLDDGSFSDVNSSHTIIPTKTKDITKIKGWMNKRFALTRNSDDESRASQKSDDGYDDGFESSCMRNAEEGSSEDRESTKTSEKLDNLLDANDFALNIEDTRLDSLQEVSENKDKNKSDLALLDKPEGVLNTSENKGELSCSKSLINIEPSASSFTESHPGQFDISEHNLQLPLTSIGSNSIYKRRVSQSLIDTISNKIMLNCVCENQSPQKTTFSETLSDSQICVTIKQTGLGDKPTIVDNIIYCKEIEQSSSNSKSAFVSEVLDNFLKNQSKLNINYELPKLKAAENITHSEEIVMPVTPPPIVSIPRVARKTLDFKGYRPKTLAEMRRMLEQRNSKYSIGESSKNLDGATSSKNNPLINKKKRTTKELMKINKVIKESFINNRKMKRAAKFYKTRSNVEGSYDKRKFRSSKRGLDENVVEEEILDLDNIEFDKKTLKKKDEESSKNKHYDTQKKIKKHFFGNFGEIKNCYPVALRRRIPFHLNSILDTCDGEIKLYQENVFSPFNLKHKVGMIMHVGLGRHLYEEAAHNLELLQGEKTEISKNFAMFAVSAFLPYKSEKVLQGTKILVPVVCKRLIDLMNQTKGNSKTSNTMKTNIITSKSNKKESKFPIKNIITSKNIQTSQQECMIESKREIKQVVEDMLQYVSNKNLFAKQEYRFDPDVPLRMDTIKDAEFISENKFFKINKKENSKLNLQLKKIGVTFIDITDVTKHEECSDNSTIENKTCSEEYCRKGCICDSLKIKDRKQDHCRRVMCMFQCKCPKSMLVKGMLSGGIVEIKSRLWLSANVMQMQHERELNLAKEEREYHQTVIRDKDKVIMMTNSKKRAIKLPVKYRDSEVFLGKDFLIEQDEANFSAIVSNDTNTPKPKKISIDEQKKKSINKKEVVDTFKNDSFWKMYYGTKMCSVVLNRDSVTNYNRLHKRRKSLNLKNRLRKRNVAIKRTTGISTSKNSLCFNKTTDCATSDDVIFVERLRGQEENEQSFGKIEHVFTLKSQDFPLDTSLCSKPLNESSKNTIEIINHEKFPLPINESSALLPKISVPSRYLVIELADDLFSVLKFKKHNITITYVNLKAAFVRAESSNKTIRIIFPVLQGVFGPVGADVFGAYAVPGLGKKMIFFGPYRLDQHHGLEGYKKVENCIISVPFIKKDSNEKNTHGIRYLWWEKVFQTTVLRSDNENIINVQSDNECNDSTIEKINLPPKHKKNELKNSRTKKKIQKLRDIKALKGNIKNELLRENVSMKDQLPPENVLTNNEPLNGNISVGNYPLNTQSPKKVAVPLIRVRTDLMAVIPQKPEETKSLDETFKNESITKSINEVTMLKQQNNSKEDRTGSGKRSYESVGPANLDLETFNKNNKSIDEISDSSSIQNDDESDGDLDVFMDQPIGVVQNLDNRKLMDTSEMLSPSGVAEEDNHMCNIVRSLQERRRKGICDLAKALGRLFVDDNQLGRMSLKGILETAVSIIQKVNENSVSLVDTLNREKAKKARLQAKLRVLRAKRQLHFSKKKVKTTLEEKKIEKTSQEKNQDPLEDSNKNDPKEDTICVTLSSEEEKDQDSSSPEIVSVFPPKKKRRLQRRRKKIIEITVSSDEEDCNDKCIDISDSDSVEITFDGDSAENANQDTSIRTTPVSSEPSFPGCVTPPSSSSKKSVISPISDSATSKLSPTDSSKNMFSNKVVVTKSKEGWYITPKGPASSFKPQGVSISEDSPVPINRLQVSGKTVLVRQNNRGGVDLTKPEKVLPKVVPDSKSSPLVKTQSVLCKNPKPKQVIMKSPLTSTVVGTVSVDRRTNKPVSIIENPMPSNTATLLQSALKDCRKSTKVLLSQGTSILRGNNVPQEKQILQKLPEANGFIKLNQPFRFALPSKTDSSSEDSLSENDSSKNVIPNKAKISCNKNITNLPNYYQLENTNSPSLCSSELKSSLCSSEVTGNKSTNEKNQKRPDSVVIKGPKLRFPKSQNSVKGVKILHPVEKH